MLTLSFDQLRLLGEQLTELSCSSAGTEIAHYAGARSALRELFELADDSADAIVDYIGKGEIFVARQNGEIVGHVQLVEGKTSSELEIKSIAVRRSHRGVGAGTRLIEASLECCRFMGVLRLTVSTSIAAFEALGFYLRRGFRICAINRDAFTPDRGYPPGLKLNRIPLNDAIELELIVPVSARSEG